MTMSTIPSHLDRVLLMTGCPGKYHLLVAFLLCCMQFPVSFSDHLLRFYSLVPPHRCKAKTNLTLSDYELRPLISTNGQHRYSSCTLYKDPLDHTLGTKGCDEGWEFLLQNGEWTIVTEWELICERESLAAFLPYTTTAAGMVGAILTGILADRYGRKYTLLISLLLHTSLGIALHFLPLFSIFATIFSLQGLLIVSVQCTAYLLLMENLPTNWQWSATLAVSIFQCCGQLLLAVLARLVRNWRYIQLVISAPGVVVVGYFWLLPRSLAWLVGEDRHESAHFQLERLSSFSEVDFKPSLRIQLLKSCRVAQATDGGYMARHGFETIVCSSRLRILAFAQFFIWFTISLISECAVEEISSLKANPYTALFTHGVLELSFVIIIFFVVNRLGLKLTQGMTMGICGILCIFSAIVDHQTQQMKTTAPIGRGVHLIPPALALLGKSIARSLTMCTMIHAAKTFPTGVRALGLGLCIFSGKVANLFVPETNDQPDRSRYVILAVGGILSFLSGLISMWILPDCTQCPLFTIAEEVEIGRTKIIDDTDLNFHECSDQDFVPNIPLERNTDSISSTSSHGRSDVETPVDANGNILTRIASVIGRKSRKFLKSGATKSESSAERLPQSTEIAIVQSHVFEPVTGFVFTWDQAQQPLKFVDFEKELSNFWKANSFRNGLDEKENNNELNNELNLLYCIQSFDSSNLRDTSL